MCGENKWTKEIQNPNDIESDEKWKVCDDCDNFIWRGQNLAMETHIQNCMYGEADVNKLSKKWMESEDPKIDDFDASRLKKSKVN